MKNRVLIITGASSINRPPEETDNTIEEVLDATLPSKQRYAKKHGYDLLSIRSFGIDKKYGFKDTEIGFLRAVRAFEMLEYYDTVMWIDADSIITNDNYTIEDFQLNEDCTFYASYDWIGRSTFSTGNFIIHNTKQTNEFLNMFYAVAKQFPTEQDALNAIHHGTNLNSAIKVLEHNFLNAVPSAIMDTTCWTGRRPIFAPWNENAFLAHLTGVSNRNRIEILNKHLNKYL
jgi:hypothetical protein